MGWCGHWGYGYQVGHCHAAGQGKSWGGGRDWYTGHRAKSAGVAGKGGKRWTCEACGYGRNFWDKAKCYKCNANWDREHREGAGGWQPWSKTFKPGAGTDGPRARNPGAGTDGPRARNMGVSGAKYFRSEHLGAGEDELPAKLEREKFLKKTIQDVKKVCGEAAVESMEKELAEVQDQIGDIRKAREEEAPPAARYAKLARAHAAASKKWRRAQESIEYWSSEARRVAEKLQEAKGRAEWHPDLEVPPEEDMCVGSDGEEGNSERAVATRFGGRGAVATGLFYPKPKSGARGRAASADAAGAAKRRCGTRSPRR